MTWHAPPLQARSRRSTQALIDSALTLLDEKPFERISVQEIVSRAGVSTGSFYARFGSKEAVLNALHERVLEEMETAFEAESPAATLQATVQSYVSTLVTQLRRQRDRLVQIRRHVTPEARTAFEERTRAFQDRISAKVRESFEVHWTTIRHPQPGLAASLALFFAAASAREAILEDGLKTWPVAIGDEILAREIARACLGYLGVATST